MNRNLENAAARAAPVVFVLLWSTGFIGMKYTLAATEPFTYLALRMALVVAFFAVIVAIARPKWPGLTGVLHSIVAGLLIHGFYLSGSSYAVYLAVPVGLSAVIPGLQPILTSTLANRWLGERVTLLQWGGLVLGLVGVLLVLHGRPMTGEVGWGWFASACALVSITIGTLYQKRFCGGIDWRAGNFIQFVATGCFTLLAAFVFETREVHWSREFVLALLWLVLALSIGSISVLFWLIRRGSATQAASLFYLVPAVTALMAYILFGERLDPLGIFGMALCAAGVVLVNKPEKPDPVSPGS